MFIDVEGIEGSGKTTLAERVSRELKRLGYRVALASGPAHEGQVERRLRNVSRDPRLLAMTPHASFLLEIARTTQQLHDFIRPALGRGEVCVTDRYVYNALADAYARGFDQAEALEAAAHLATQDVWPDLVLLLDVDPELGQLRRELRHVTDGTPLRTSLHGDGFAKFQRDALLEMARRDPHRWVVIETGLQSLEVLVERVVEILLLRLQGAESEARAKLPYALSRVNDPADVEASFFSAVDAVEDREGALALLLLKGISGPAAHQRRVSWAPKKPELVARSLRGLSDEESFRLREVLAEVCPGPVLEGLGEDHSQRALRLRAELIERAPEEALRGLRGDDSPQAWWLREQGLKLGAISAVLESLAGMDTDRSWRVRVAQLVEGRYSAVAPSLVGLSSLRADSVRETIAANDPIAALRSTRGLSTVTSLKLRDALVNRAPAVVLESIEGVDTPHAWELREKLAPRCPEALRSIRGMDSESAWSLRMRYATLWPTAALESLGTLGKTERGAALIEAALRSRPSICSLRAAYQATVTAATPMRPAPMDEESRSVA
ncbi:MAG: dTMP kinase [Myxococcaceae bacterium]